jgi:hypothetical protein
MFSTIITLCFLSLTLSQKIVSNYPTLPTLWEAETIEPGAPGSGQCIESYDFVSVPTTDTPSAMWSNYTGCQRLIFVTSGYNAKRYLLGCDALDCCWEEQDGNQVEFQIPNVHYTNPNQKTDIYYQRVNITNFGEEVEVDEWSWNWSLHSGLHQEWKAYTNKCDDCVNGVELVQWSSSAMGSSWYPIQFRRFKGYDRTTDDGMNFINIFQLPEICKKNNLLKCPGSSSEISQVTSSCTGPHESCCPAPMDDPNNCPQSARTTDCDAKKSCCCG